MEKLQEILDQLKLGEGVEKVATDNEFGFETDEGIMTERFDNVDDFAAGARVIIEAIQNGWIKVR